MKALLKHIVFTALILVSSQGFAQTTTTLQAVPNRMPALVKRWGLTPIGQMDTTTQLNFTIGLQLQNRQAFDQLLQNLYDPQSPEYRKFLSHQQVVQEFCPTEAAYQTVVSLVESDGLSVTRQYADHMLIDVKGSITAIQRALHVKMLLYKRPGQNSTFYAPSVAPSVNLSTPIQAITGLSNYHIPQPLSTTNQANGNTSHPVVSSGGSTDGYYNGNDLRNAYIPNVSLNGNGQKVGLLEFAYPSGDSLTGGFYPSDITEYDSISGLPQVPIAEINQDPANDYETPNSYSVDEFTVDIEMANAMAPGLDSIIVYYGDNSDGILDSMMANTSVKQFSASWIYWADNYTPTQLAIMAAQGQTFFNGSGDLLCWDYDPSDPSLVLGEDPPFDGVVDTCVTFVGGTQLSTNGPGGSYSSEVVWNAGNDQRGSGGGIEGPGDVNAVYIPTYQLDLDGVNGASSVCRNGPDVAMVATNILEVSQDGKVFGSGGTSFATPLWAGFMALVNQQAATNGYTHGVGFLNPLLYSLGEGNSYDNCFHDIQSGNNDYSSSSGSNGYSAGAGYDLCTGWGSPNGQTLINFLSSTVWDSTVVLNSSYTVPSGESLIIEPGTTVQLASGVGITASGVINAVGTAAEPITITSTGGTSPGSWGSIILSGSGADNSTLKYCKIDYATDIEVNNTSNVTIANSSISNSSGTGISVYNTSNFLAEYDSVAVTDYNTGISIDGGSNNNCFGNVVYNAALTEGGIGIEYDASSGTVGENDVDYLGSGILAEFGSSPNADPQPPNHNNRATNCDYGLDIYDQSYCDFGAGGASGAYTLNSIYNNSPYDAAVGYFYSSDPSGLYAYYNWWGSPNPSPSLFYVSSACYGYFGNPLSSDPWGSTPLPSGTRQVTANGVRIADAASRASDPAVRVESYTAPTSLQDSLLAGIALREKGEFTEAKNYFMSFINTHPDNSAGYVELYGCANNAALPDIVNLFKAPPAQAPDIVQLLLGYLYQMEDKPSLAQQVNDKIISGYPNTPSGVKAEINNMLIDLYDLNDLRGAQVLLDSVKAHGSLLAPMDLYAAEKAVASRGGPPVSGSQKATSVASSGLPKSFGLSQNYPNPFNPTTVIDYQLPKDARVTIKVYDVLGRQVASLVDREETAGYHEVSFDGTRFASGLYFYRFTAPGINKVMKMLLVK